jgi:hypothetical protein
MSASEHSHSNSGSTEGSSSSCFHANASDSDYVAGSEAGESSNTDSTYDEGELKRAAKRNKVRQTGIKRSNQQHKSRRRAVAVVTDDGMVSVSEVTSSSAATSCDSNSNDNDGSIQSWPEGCATYELFAGDVEFYADFPAFHFEDTTTDQPGASSSSLWPRPVQIKHAAALQKLKHHVKKAAALNISARSYKFKMAAAKNVRAHEITLPKRSNRLQGGMQHAVIAGASNSVRSSSGFL